MSNLTKKPKPDRSKIDADNPKELKYWAKALDAPKDEVLAAIEKVGNSAGAVRKELAKSLDPDDIPLNAHGKKITKQDGTPIAEASNPAVASDVADRLNGDEARREEETRSA